MRRRDLGAVVGFVIVTAFVAGVSLMDFRSLTSRRVAWAASNPPSPIEVVLRWFVIAVGGLVVLGVIVLLAHQYVRWKEFRPAIHLAVGLVAFVGALAWLLGPAGIGSSAEGLTPDETQLIRVAGFGLLAFLVLFIARHLEDTDDDTG